MFSNNLHDVFGRVTFDVSEAEINYLMKHQLKPVFASEYIPTLYDYELDEGGIRGKTIAE